MARVRGTQIYSPEILEELKTAMAAQSRVGEDDEVTFRQKINALQRFLNHGMSRFSIDAWHHSLSTLFHADSHHHDSILDAGDGRPVIRKLRGVADLRGLSRDVIMQREGGTIREADTQALKYLDNFMAALQCVREAKSCIAEMYRFMYRYYFDPDAGKENTIIRSAQPLSRAHTLNPVTGKPDHVNPFETSAKQFGILTLQQMSGTTGHKLRRTVTDMQEILQRWDRLMAVDGEINPDDLDAESQQDLQLLSGTGAFESVLRLLPDIFAKYYKCLELAKQWWILAHEIYPELPIGRSPTPSTLKCSRESTQRSSSRESRVSTLSSPEESVPYSEQLSNVTEDIQLNEDLQLSLAEEMKLLEVRERHFESLLEAYERVTAELGEKTRERKELIAVKEKESFLPNNQMLDPAAKQNFAASSDSKIHPESNLSDISEQVDRADREIKMLQFQQSLLRQDYMLQLEIRPSLIRFADDLRIRTQEVQKSLTEQKTEQARLQTLLQEGNKSHSTEEDKVPTARQELTDDNSTDIGKSQPTSDAFGKDNTGKLSKSKPHTDKNRTQRVDSSPRSKPEVDERSDTPDSSSHPLNASQTAAPRKVSERKMSELSRLHSKPLREVTPGSTPDPDTVSLPAPETQRKKSLPERQVELKSRRSVPLLKISKPAENKTSADNAGSTHAKPGKAPTLNGLGASLSPRPPQKATANGTTANSGTTEALFQRRLVKPKNREENSRDDEGHSDHLSTRPRSKSDPHSLKPRQRALKPLPETSGSLTSAEAEKGDLGKDLSKRNSLGSSSKSKPRDIRKDSDPVSRETKPAGVSRRDNDPVQKSKPSDNKEDGTPSQKQAPAAARKESDTSSPKLKPDDVRKGATSLGSKSAEGKQNNNVKSRVTNVGDNDTQKSSDASSNKLKATSQKPKIVDGRRESLVASQQASKTRDDKAKSETVSSQKPKEKNGDKSETSGPALRPKEGIDKKQNGETSPRKSPRDSKGGDNVRNAKAADLKKDASVTSHRSNVTESRRDTKTTPLANGVIGKGKKQS